MKFDISWHQNCLVNMKRNLKQVELELSRKKAGVIRLRDDVAFYERQLAEAVKLKKDAFDSSLFMKKERLTFPRNLLHISFPACQNTCFAVNNRATIFAGCAEVCPDKFMKG